jgi:hypothetical protein
LRHDLIRLKDNIGVALDQRKKYLEADLYTTSAEGLTALGLHPEEDPKWDMGFSAVGAILISKNGEYLASADPREETTTLGK